MIDDSLRDFSVEELRQTRPDLLLIVLFYQEEDRRALISQRVDMPLRMLPFQTSLVLEWFKGL